MFIHLFISNLMMQTASQGCIQIHILAVGNLVTHIAEIAVYQFRVATDASAVLVDSSPVSLMFTVAVFFFSE